MIKIVKVTPHNRFVPETNIFFLKLEVIRKYQNVCVRWILL